MCYKSINFLSQAICNTYPGMLQAAVFRRESVPPGKYLCRKLIQFLFLGSALILRLLSLWGRHTQESRQSRRALCGEHHCRHHNQSDKFCYYTSGQYDLPVLH